MKMRDLLGIAFPVILLGCSTMPSPTDQARDVPSTRILNASLLERREGLGQVIVIRDATFRGVACKDRVFVNGAPVADLAPNEKVTVFLPEGQQLLAAMPMGFCYGGLVETKAFVNLSRPERFRVGNTGDGFFLQPTAF
jgi:hypothetical protein